MKTIVLVCFVACATGAFGREIVPGVVSFDEPPGLHGFGPHHDPGDNPFELSRTIIQYQPDSNGPNSFRQFDIGIGVVGYEIGQGKRVIYRKLDEDGLRRELASKFSSRENASTTTTPVRETMVSERKAYFISTSRPMPSFRPDAVFWSEWYYIPFEPNRGVTLSLVADSEEKLAGLRELLKRISIPADAHVIAPPPPPPPLPEEVKRNQIIYNLRMIMAAGDQSELRYGRHRFTFAELKADFGTALPTTSVDGENYEDLVWDSGKQLRVKTKTLGELQYPP